MARPSVNITLFFDATVGETEWRVNATADRDPEADRIRVILGGCLASAPAAAELAAELAALIEQEKSRSAPPRSGAPSDKVEVSVRGLRMRLENENVLVDRIREHIRKGLPEAHPTESSGG